MKKTFTIVTCAVFTLSSMLTFAQAGTKTPVKKEEPKKEVSVKKEEAPVKKEEAKKEAPAKKEKVKKGAAKKAEVKAAETK